MRFSTALFHAKNAALLALLWGGSLWAYAHLPATMPGHFDLLGEVSYRTDTTLPRWLLMPLLGTFIAGSLYGVAYLMRRFPRLMNVPDPTTFNRLSTERQEVVVHLVQDVLYGIAALLLLVVGVLQMGMYSVAVHAASMLPVYTRVVVWMSMPLLVALGPVAVWGLHATIQRLYREQMR